jgi:hypothetical protein
VFRTEENTQTPVRFLYSDYRLIDGVAAPGRVEQFLGERPYRTLKIESVDFHPSFSDDELSLR